MLIRSMAHLRADLQNWKLVIAGVDEFGHKEELRYLVTDLGMEPHVQFVGPLYGQDKRDAFAAADLFVLPSHSEGAPITILEALGAGVPVLTTTASPWEDLLTHDCGWWTEITEGALAESLEDALRKPKEVLSQMGQRGQALVVASYTWRQVARRTIQLYEWLLSRSAQPIFVIKE